VNSVPGGTGLAAFKGAPYTSGGKTGTAQLFGIKQNEKYKDSHVTDRLKDHAWFIAFAPADHPKIALAVIVENGGFGAASAAPIARRALDYYLLGQLPVDPKKPVEDPVDAGGEPD
jgi:penicillin-binding protein 2